jgi:C4-dicarboxylate transporter, DctQ subunit
MAVVMLRRLATALEAATAALLLAAVTLNFANVIARYLFGRPIVMTEEILQYANVWIVMLAAAAVTRLDLHLRLDVLLPTGRPRLLRILELAIAALGAGLALFVVVQGVRIVALTYDVGQRSIAAGIPLAAVYLAIPIGFGCGLVFLLDRLWRLWREPELPDIE